MVSVELSYRIDSLLETLSTALTEETFDINEWDEEARSLLKFLDIRASLTRGAVPDIDDDISSYLSNLRSLQTGVNTTAVFHGVTKARKGQVEKVEYEALAKLVNKMRNRDELLRQSSQYESTMTDLMEQREELDQNLSTKDVTAKKLLSLVYEVRRSIEEEPSSPELPPLSEVDPSLFNL
jgi:hypothetical protein